MQEIGRKTSAIHSIVTALNWVYNHAVMLEVYLTLTERV